MDLGVWKEKGLSSTDEAKARYQRILANADTLPFSELDERLRNFIREISGKQFQEAILGAPTGANLVDQTFSRHGVILRFGDDSPKDAYGETLGSATDFDLTMYDPEMGMGVGYDDSLDVEIYDAKRHGS